jgi:hypothetical protein
MAAQDVHCHTGFRLVVRAENFTPACVRQLTATALILRGWSLGTPLIEPFISRIDINGLQQNYAVGQPINATVNCVGYWRGIDKPDVKIFDANGTQIWFNCPDCFMDKNTITGGIASIPSYGTFTYSVMDTNGHPPVINETGTFTMIASLANKTSRAQFTVNP